MTTDQYSEGMNLAPQQPAPPPSFRIIARGFNNLDVWYNDVKLQNVDEVSFNVAVGSPTTVAVHFRGVAVEYESHIRTVSRDAT